MLDFSKFRQGFTKDSEADLNELTASKKSDPIPEGVHEVVVIGLTEKDGKKIKMLDRAGGSIGFNILVQNAQRQQQAIYMEVPLAMPFKAACQQSYVFVKTLKFLKFMGIDPNVLRESVIISNGASLDLLKGTQFLLINSWDSKSLHLEYDKTYKAYYFVTSQGHRFDSGEMSVPVNVDKNKPYESRFSEAHAIAKQHHYTLTTQMQSDVEPHPTASNASINEALAAVGSKDTRKVTPPVINKTIPPFPVKKPTAPIETDEDIPF